MPSQRRKTSLLKRSRKSRKLRPRLPRQFQARDLIRTGKQNRRRTLLNRYLLRRRTSQRLPRTRNIPQESRTHRQRQGKIILFLLQHSTKIRTDSRRRGPQASIQNIRYRCQRPKSLCHTKDTKINKWVTFTSKRLRHNATKILSSRFMERRTRFHMTTRQKGVQGKQRWLSTAFNRMPK